MANTYVCSDLHFFHDNIVEHCNRQHLPLSHNDWILEKVNKGVCDDDIVYHLGDFAYGKYKLPDLKDIISKLNGSWIFTIGNHDKVNQLKVACEGTRHTVVSDYHTIRYKEKIFIMFHYPIQNWWNMYRGSIHLHGHTHDNSPPKIKNRHNVCLDYENRIYTLDEFIGKDEHL